MALTLIESAKLALGRDETLKATIMELFASSSDMLRTLPFQNIPGGSLIFNREQKLPTVGFRSLNEAYAEGTGEVDRIQEPLFVAGGDIDVDTYFEKTGNFDQRAAQESMKIKALSLAITKTIVKGDTESNSEEFDGLQVRCIGDQLVSTGAVAGGSVLSLAKLDEVYDAVEDPTHWLMNKTMRRRLTAAARLYTVGGYITYEKDEFGRTVTMYNDLPILIADKDNNYDDIMPFTEAAASSTSQCTSIYCLSFAENGVVGIQNGEMDVRDMGEIDEKPVYRTRVEWLISIAVLRARAVARLRYIKDGAVAA